MLYMDDLKSFANSKENGIKMVMIMFEFSTDIGMAFGIDKCKTLNIIGGKYSKCGGVELPDKT